MDQSIQQIKAKIAQLDATQNAIKLITNSLYGIIGSKYSPIYDTDMAEAVTLTGQSVIRISEQFIDEELSKLAKTPITNAVIAQDTDSNYFECKHIVEKYANPADPKTYTKTAIKNICKEADAFVEVINKRCAEFLNTSCHTKRGNRIEFKREVFASEGIFFAKKKYALHIRDKEGIIKDDYKYTGVEVRKRELPKEVSALLKEAYEGLCAKRWGYQEFYDHVKKLWLQYQSLPLEQIAIYKRYRTEKEESDDFLGSTKGALAHVRGLQYHNDLLVQLGLDDKYNQIKLGDVCRFCWVKPENPYGINVIAFGESYPEEFKSLFTVDYDRMFDSSFRKFVSSICTILKWHEITIEDFNAKIDIMDL